MLTCKVSNFYQFFKAMARVHTIRVYCRYIESARRHCLFNQKGKNDRKNTVLSILNLSFLGKFST